MYVYKILYISLILLISSDSQRQRLTDTNTHRRTIDAQVTNYIHSKKNLFYSLPHAHTCIYIYKYIYIEREKKREREREREKEREREIYIYIYIYVSL